MQKRIFWAALVLMVFVLVAVACGKKDGGTNSNEPFSYTTEADGTMYVTNVYGDLIPVTTGADGSMEMLEDLYTKTLAQVEEEKKALETASKNASATKSPDESQANASQGGTTESQSKGSGIQVGSENAQGDGKEAVIVW